MTLKQIHQELEWLSRQAQSSGHQMLAAVIRFAASCAREELVGSEPRMVAPRPARQLSVIEGGRK